MEILLQLFIALIVGFHGLVYFMGGMWRISGLFEGWRERSLFLRGAITGNTLRRLTRALWIIAGIGTIATGITIALASPSLGLWRPIAIAASVIAVVSFVVSWDGQGRRSVNQGLIGMVLSAIILISAIVFPLAFA
jgi:hypothetical protein